MPVTAAKKLRGPVEAIVVKVIDGDTFVADAAVWPGQTVRVNIRIRGIDAPEMKRRLVPLGIDFNNNFRAESSIKVARLCGVSQFVLARRTQLNVAI
jgi:endonuclease YncB( thermonuclease family)